MDAIQQILAVVFVLGLLLAMLFILRRQGAAGFSGFRAAQPAAPRRLQVIERLPLSTQHSLQLVRMDGRTLLLGLYPGGCNLLTTAEEERQRGVSQ